MDSAAAGNSNPTQSTSKEMAIISDKLNCYRNDLLVWEGQIFAAHFAHSLRLNSYENFL